MEALARGRGRAAGTLARAAAFTAVICFISSEVAHCIASFSGAAEAVPYAGPLPAWLGELARSTAARMATAAAALCYLGRDLEVRLAASSTAARLFRPLSRDFGPVDLSALKAAASLAVISVVACQIGSTWNNVVFEIGLIMGDPEAAAARAPKTFLEWKARFEGPFSLGSVVATVAFHYLYSDFRRMVGKTAWRLPSRASS